MMPISKQIIQYYMDNPNTTETAIQVAIRFDYCPECNFELRGKRVRDLKRTAMNKLGSNKPLTPVVIQPSQILGTYDENLDKGTLEVSKLVSEQPRSADEIIEIHKIDKTKWRLVQYWSKEKQSGWLVSALFASIKPEDSLPEDIQAVLREVFLESNISPCPTPKKTPIASKRALFVYMSDKHVGALTHPNALFSNEYNEDVFEVRMMRVLEEIEKQVKIYGRLEDIFICDLGDSLDGWSGHTTRGGHQLPQNMNNKESFMTYLYAHKRFFDELQEKNLANNIHAIMQTEDNHCFTDEVEVLTSNGWKHYVDVLESDTIATLNTQTNSVEYQTPIDRIYNTITEPIEIHEYHGRSFSVEVTSEHRMYCKPVSTGATQEKEYTYILSKDLNKGAVKFLSSLQNINPEFTEVSDALIQLAGWITTDGSIRHNTYIIHQSKPKGILKIEALVDSLGVDVDAIKRVKRSKPATHIKGKTVKVNYQMYSYVFSKTTVNSEIIKTLKQYIPTKDIPYWVEKLSKRQFNLYLQAIIDGDGSVKDGVTTSTTVYGKYDFLNELQRLCILNGHRSVLNTNNRGDHTLSITFDRSEYDYKLRGKKIVTRLPKYTWCLTLPNSNMVVRHNGKVSVQGNSGSFGYITNQALTLYLNTAYPFIKVTIMEKFLEHFDYGKHTFIFTHGKDSEDLKHGLPLFLTEKAENFLNKYIDHHGLGDNKNISIVKGDLHTESMQQVYKFRYRNVLSMYGSSKWIMNNFGPGYPGVSFDLVEKDTDLIYSFYIRFK